MSYEIYCYRSKLGKPDIEEACEAIGEEYANTESESHVSQEHLAQALIAHNPRLKSTERDYEEIARLPNNTPDEAKKPFDSIELNPPEGDLAIQITISAHSATLTIPYWYKKEKAARVFQDVMDYLKVIRQTAGYFAYDPQTEEAFDPLITKTKGLESYLQITGESGELPTRPWWKFW